MSYQIETIAKFDRQLKALAKKYPTIKEDFLKLVAELSENPFLGTLLFNDVYKIRMKITSKGKGKSGGARVIYFNLFAQSDSDKVVLISIYDKSEKETVSDKEIKKALKAIG